MTVYHPLLVETCPGAILTLDRDESRHAASVRRLREGDSVIVINGQGKRAQGTIHRADRDALQVGVHSVETLSRARPSLHLWAAWLKHRVWPGVLRQAVETGTDAVLPLALDNNETRSTVEALDNKLERWRDVCMEACKQSGNAFLPHLDAVAGMDEACEHWNRLPEPRLGLLASLENDARSILPVLALAPPSHYRSVVIAIGPEGGFTQAEEDAFKKLGFARVRLGQWTLRAETACVSALAILANWRLAGAVSPLSDPGSNEDTGGG